MARREVVRRSTAGVQLIEVVHQMSRQVFSLYAVTTPRVQSSRDFVSLRTARAAFDKEVAACRGLDEAEKDRSPDDSRTGDRRAADTAGAGGQDGPA